MADKKVSVCVVTYNQEKYIGQCLQSLADQVVDFEYEVLVSDDASSDQTPEIVQGFQERYPDIFKTYLHKQNKGAGANYLFVHSKAVGDYIAHVDGDDYYYVDKLKVQADFLDKHPNCNIVWHKMRIELSDGRLKEYVQTNPENFKVGEYLYDMEFDRAAILQFIAVGANSSKMYRRSVREFDVADFETLDYFANVEQIGDGVGCYACDLPLGVYRAGVGLSSGSDKTRVLLYKTFMFFYKKYPEYRSCINAAVLTYLISDLKNRRKTFWLFFKAYILTFHPASVVKLYRGMRIVRQLRFSK
ncbi:glycosyltransferase family 2 protein [Pseudomonas urmiensis]|uniref:glycosyltransferase family 2 protein n=1 Tax=Pseudomonas urmiensis TaxID=2745493 RepID=UPI003C855CE6